MATSTESSVSPHFLRLPSELRLQIYSYLLLVQPLPPTSQASFLVSHPDYNETHPSSLYCPSSPTSNCAYYTDHAFCPKGDLITAQRTLHFRNTSQLTTASIAHRTHYKIRADRFRARCVDATYLCINAHSPHHHIYTSILGACRQVHAEAAPLLYGSYTFAFDTNIEAACPLFADLTPRSRQSVRSLSIVKRALPYDKDFDRCEWKSTCAYLARELTGLHNLRIGVVAGRPREGWDDVRPFAASEFECITASFEEMSWVRDLASFAVQTACHDDEDAYSCDAETESSIGLSTSKAATATVLRSRLKSVDIVAHTEHCPAPTSSSMAFFVAFSKSVDGGFREYLTKRLLEPDGGSTSTLGT